MKAIYIDCIGNKMEMETEEFNLEFDVIFRQYKIFDSFSFIIDPSREQKNKMRKNKKKHPDDFVYITTKITCPSSNPFNEENWKITFPDDMPEDFKDKVDVYYYNSLRAFITNNSRIDRVLLNVYTSLGDTYFFNTVTLSDLKDMTIHLYGRSTIYTKRLKNMLLFLHGEDCVIIDE